MGLKAEVERTWREGVRRASLACFLTLAITLSAVLSVVPASAAVSSRPGSLNAAMERGILDRGVVQRIRERGSVDALVTVDGTQALADARSRAAHVAVPERAARSVLSVTTSAYEALKSHLPETGTVVEDYPALPVSLVRFDSEQDLLVASRDPAVVSIQVDGKVRIDMAQSLPLIRQPQAVAAGYSGTGTAVAVLDTGVDYTRPAFGACSAPGGSCKVAFAQDFAPEDGMRDVGAQGGHGTNVAAIAVGVAPATKILSLDVIDGAYGHDSDIIAAINWAIENKATYGIASANMSFGDATYHTTECTNSPYTAPFANLRAVGILPVVAAGNHAYEQGPFRDGLSGPACAPGAVRVGATYDSSLGKVDWGDCVDRSTAADQPTCFSQGGPLLSVWAPGANIAAGGLTYSGTSQATPHVAGAVAVAASADPGAAASVIQSAIENSGPMVTDDRDGVSKHRLDVAAAAQALAAGSVPPTPSPDPTPPPDPDPSPSPDPDPSPDPSLGPTPPPGGDVLVSGRMTHYRGKRGEYYLIGSRKDARYEAELAPAVEGQQVTLAEGEQMTFDLERKREDGTWAIMQTRSVTMDERATAAVPIHRRDLRPGGRYRVHASYDGDASNPPASSEYSMFRPKRSRRS
ncbi:MAG: S8 family serine peptidase [Actinomycetota bacterium]